MEERIRPSDPLRKRFLEKATTFSDKYPKEGRRLYGELLLWASFVPEMGGDTRVWDIIKSQINYRVQQHNKAGNPISAKDFIDFLSLRSVLTGKTLVFVDFSSFLAVIWSVFSFLAQITTLAPSFAKPKAIAFPIP